MRLSAAQVAQFSAEGYLHIASALSPPEVHAITEAFEQTLAPYAAGVNVLAPPGGAVDRSRRTQISAAIQRHPTLCRLLDHPAVVGLIGAVIGSDFNYTGACLLTASRVCALTGCCSRVFLAGHQAATATSMSVTRAGILTAAGASCLL